MEYVLNIVILVGLYVILSSSFNLIIGHGGLISIAHPIFYAIGAYCSALLSINFHMPLVLSILCGAVLAMLVSAAVALPSVLTTLGGLGCAVRDLSIGTPSLEDVFIHLTGRELR